MARKKRKFLEERQQEQQQKKFRDGVVVQGKSLSQKHYIAEIKNSDIVICTGPAGTGKTAVAVGLGLQAITAAQPAYEKMVVLRPVKEACGEHLGYLPGDLKEKMSVWVAPIIDNMEIFVDQNQIKNLFYEKKVEVIPLAYARGRSLNKAFILVDEAQNCSVDQMLMILTRLGMGSKLVINGDLTQCDSRYYINGLKDAVERLQGMDGVSIIEMGCSKEDIIRNPLIAEIIQRYSNRHEEPRRNEQCEPPLVASLENMAKPDQMR